MFHANTGMGFCSSWIFSNGRLFGLRHFSIAWHFHPVTANRYRKVCEEKQLMTRPSIYNPASACSGGVIYKPEEKVRDMNTNLTTHELSIGIERCGNSFFLKLKAKGKLSHEDYEIITPMIDSALGAVKEPKVKALIDGTELEGWEPRAAWDDFKLGLKHGNEFVKVAIYGNKKWQETLTKLGSWFISGEVKFFENKKDAIDWLNY
nr:STAS/SEC14 domain-containing protein [Marinobacterium sedimentorum]